MVAIAWVCLGLAIGYVWLRGGWIVATMLSIVWFLFSMLVFKFGAFLFISIIGFAIIWAPFAGWRMFGDVQADRVVNARTR